MAMLDNQMAFGSSRFWAFKLMHALKNAIWNAYQAHQRPTGSAPEEFMVAIHITQPATMDGPKWVCPNMEVTPKISKIAISIEDMMIEWGLGMDLRCVLSNKPKLGTPKETKGRG